MRNPNWTREQLILAFNLYCKIPFGRISKTSHEIIELAKLIGRTPSAVGLKLSNLASFDPNLQARGIKGMKHAGKGDRLIFEEFHHDREALAFESENILAKYQGVALEEKYKNQLPDLSDRVGDERVAYVKTRVNQNFFRGMILANYHGKCSITGIDIPDLLIASHIIPWSENQQERLNPQNGICLSALYDKAFDRGLISFDDDCRMMLSKMLKDYCDRDYFKTYFGSREGQKLVLPARAIPCREFLEWHQQNLFCG